VERPARFGMQVPVAEVAAAEVVEAEVVAAEAAAAAGVQLPPRELARVPAVEAVRRAPRLRALPGLVAQQAAREVAGMRR
jgi:hypothetical protein